MRQAKKIGGQKFKQFSIDAIIKTLFFVGGNMRKLYTLLSLLSLVSFFQISAHAKADPGCLKMLKQAKKTCKKQHRCVYEALNAAGFDIVNTGTEVFCKGDPKKGMEGPEAGKAESSPLRAKDRSKSKKDSPRVPKRKSGIQFE